MHVVVIGGGAAGLSASLGLARRGHRVTVLERDPAPQGMDVEQAFAGWSRKGVPQSRQGHFVLGRAIDMLDRHAPDVLTALADEGIVPPYNPLLMLISEDELQPGDEFLRPLPTRRISFELTLRRVAEAEPGIEIRSCTKAAGLRVAASAGLPRVCGVGLEDGSEIACDFVIDAGGNRSPVQRWLRTAGAALPPGHKQESGATYVGRYYRARGDAPDPWALMQSASGTPYLECVVFPGDRATFGVMFVIPSWDRELHSLRKNDAFDRGLSMFPSVASWVSADVAEPLNPVEVAAGHSNALRPFLAEGLPSYLGCLPVGDALGTTDPRLGLGLSFALTHGFAAAKAVSDHPDDPGDAALAYDSAVMPEFAEYLAFTSADSRINFRKWRGEPLDPRDADEERAVALVNATPDVLFSDPVLLRAFLRVAQLTDRPSDLFKNAAFVAKVSELNATRGDPATAESGPSREEFLRTLDKPRREPCDAPS